MDAAVEIRNLRVAFRTRASTVVALDDLTLSVESGHVVGFLGPNGAGKTTAMHVLLGFVEPTSGEARLFGRDVRESIARERIGYLPENPDTYRFLTARELLTFSGQLFRMSGRTLRDRVQQLLDEMDLAAAADRKLATYSRGMLQRVGLAQSLVHNPDLLILDEPTSGLDPIARVAVRQVIARLRAAGKTVFFSSHELSEVELVCDSLAIVSRGRLVAQGPAANLVAPGESLERFFMRVVQ